MTDLETLREELAAKTRALADSEAECERLRSQVIPGQALSEMLADAQRHGGASASALWRSRVDGLTEERDTLRADLQKQTKRARDAEVERDKLQNRLAGTLPKGGHDSSPALVVERLKDRLIAKAGETVEQAALRVVLESDRRRSENQKLREENDSERAMNAKLTEEGDTLRAQLAEAQAELEEVSHALSLVQRSGLAARDEMRGEILTLRSRLTACEPVVEAVREVQAAYGSWNAALPSYLKDELWTVYQRKVAKLRASDLVLPAKVTT